MAKLLTIEFNTLTQSTMYDKFGFLENIRTVLRIQKEILFSVCDRLEASHKVEEFVVNRTLPLPVEASLEFSQAIFDISLSGLHRYEPAGIFAGH